MNLFVGCILTRREKSLLLLSCLSISPSVRLSAPIDSAPTGRISPKFGIDDFYETLSRRAQILLKLDQSIGYFTLIPKCVLRRCKIAIRVLSLGNVALRSHAITISEEVQTYANAPHCGVMRTLPTSFCSFL